MKRIGRFFSSPPAYRRLFLKSAFLLVAIRIGLWLLPFRVWRRFLARNTQTATESQDADQVLVQGVASSVRVMSRYVPAATCLTQALAARALLARLGQPAHLRIGVAKSKEGQFEAHAWVESRGKIVVGNQPDLSRFVIMPLIKEEIS